MERNNTLNNRISFQKLFSVLACNIWIRLKTIVKVTDRAQRTNLTISGDKSFLTIKFLC